MTIIRRAHTSKFTVIPNALAQDMTISLKAKGLMIYFLSLPNKWSIRVCHLTQIMQEGRTSILNAIKELKAKGYIHHVKKGFEGGWEYLVFEEPISEDELKIFLRTNRFPNNWETEQLGNQHLSNTKDSIKEKEDHHKDEDDDSFSKKKRKPKEALETVNQVFDRWVKEGRPPDIIEEVRASIVKLPTGTITHPKQYLEKVYDQKKAINVEDELIQMRRAYVKKNPANYAIEGSTVSYISGSRVDKHQLRGSEEFWKPLKLDRETYKNNLNQQLKE